MDKKHFSSYAERVRNAKEQAKKAQKKERKGKFTKSQWVTFILMIVWTIASILGVWGFSRTFDSKGSKMQVIGASAAEIENGEDTYTFSLNGLTGATFNVSSSTKYVLAADLVFEVITNEYQTLTIYTIDGDGAVVSVSIQYNVVSSPSTLWGPRVTTNNITDNMLYPNSFDIDTSSYSGAITLPLGAIPLYADYWTEQDYSSIYIRIAFKQLNSSVLYYLPIRFSFTGINGVPLYPVYSSYFHNLLPTIPPSTSLDVYAYREYINEVSYESYYNAYNDGYNSGLEGARQEIDNAYNNGYSVGYNEGLNAENPYTFGNLLSSVIDVPINAFKSLLNFELLGVNLLSFAEGLITIALLLALVKLLI